MVPRSSVDYATDNITVYRFCEYGCVYCWAWRVPVMRSRISRGKYDPVEEARRYLLVRGPRTIVVSFTSDPYPPKEGEVGLTRAVLEVLCRGKQHAVLVLTKNPSLALRDVDLLRSHGNAWLGTTVTVLRDREAGVLEPNAPLPKLRLRALKYAHLAGVRTWVSIEPIIPYVTYPARIIEASKDFVDWYVLGSFNYFRVLKVPKLRKVMPERFTEEVLRSWYVRYVVEAVELLESLGKPYFIKKELLRYLPRDYIPRLKRFVPIGRGL